MDQKSGSSSNLLDAALSFFTSFEGQSDDVSSATSEHGKVHETTEAGADGPQANGDGVNSQSADWIDMSADDPETGKQEVQHQGNSESPVSKETPTGMKDTITTSPKPLEKADEYCRDKRIFNGVVSTESKPQQESLDKGGDAESKQQNKDLLGDKSTDPETGEGNKANLNSTFCQSESAPSDLTSSSNSLNTKTEDKDQQTSFAERIRSCYHDLQTRWNALSIDTRAIITILSTALFLVLFLSTVIKVHQKRNDDGQRIFGFRPYHENTLQGTPFVEKTPPPTFAPTTTPVGKVMERLQSTIDDFSPRDIDRQSPQYQAVVWMAGQVYESDEDDDVSITVDNSTTANDTGNDQHFLQLYVLASCFFAWSGKEWANADESNWLSLSPVPNITDITAVCDWMGVKCNENAIMTSLQLPKQELWGTIVSELGLLTSLEMLDLSSNSLGGLIPSELGRLSLLRILDLSNNQYLSGSFPDELTTLSKLESVQVQGNPDLSSGMRNFMPCGQTPPKLVADCGLPSDMENEEGGRDGKDTNEDRQHRQDSPPKQPQVLCPCCTECCHYSDPSTTTKGELLCLEHEPYIDQKSLAQFGSR